MTRLSQLRARISRVGLLCLLVGAILAAALRPLLLLSRLELYVGPLTIIYPSLIATLSRILWIPTGGIRQD